MRRVPWSQSTQPAIHYHFLFNIQVFVPFHFLSLPAHPATGARQGHGDAALKSAKAPFTSTVFQRWAWLITNCFLMLHSKEAKNYHNKRGILNLTDAGNHGMTEEYRREIKNLTTSRQWDLGYDLLPAGAHARAWAEWAEPSHHLSAEDLTSQQVKGSCVPELLHR